MYLPTIWKTLSDREGISQHVLWYVIYSLAKADSCLSSQRSISLFVKTNTMWVIKTVIILNIREEKELPQRRSSNPEYLTRESDWVKKTDPKRGACLPTETRTWDQSCQFIHKEWSINHHPKRWGVYTRMGTCVPPCTCSQTWVHAHTHMHTELLCSPSAPGGQHKGSSSSNPVSSNFKTFSWFLALVEFCDI